jgi:Fe-S-cluster containining protein
MADFPGITLAATRASLYVLRTQPRSRAMLEQLVDWSHQQSEAISERLQASEDPLRRRLPVCAEGCAYCCYQGVSTAAPEILRIAEYLRKTLDANELAAVRERVARVAQETRDMSTEERIEARIACPLLDEEHQTCTVFEVRPTNCRAYNSCDVGQCHKAFEARDPHMPIPGNALQQASMQAVWLGMVAACCVEGLDAEVVELSAGLAAALVDDASTRAWLAGHWPPASAVTPLARFARKRHAHVVEHAASTARADPGRAPSTSIAGACARAPERRRRASREEPAQARAQEGMNLSHPLSQMSRMIAA